MSSGERTTTFRRGSADALLRSYLIFVRDLRGQRREPSIELRSDDVGVLATHLGVGEEVVLGGLLDLMGATRAQRSAMLAMLAAGALTVVLTGSVVSGLSDDGVSVEFGRLADAVHAAVSSAEGSATDTSTSESDAVSSAEGPATDTSTSESTTAHRAMVAPAASEPTQLPSQSAAPPSTASRGTATDRPPAQTSARGPVATTPRPEVLRSVAAATAGDVPSSSSDDSDTFAGSASGEPVSIGVAPDGSVVASVAPPVPAVTPEEPVAIAELPDGTTVGVAAPPVPPSSDEPVATAELPDGTTVGVAAPPVPPAPPD